MPVARWLQLFQKKQTFLAGEAAGSKLDKALQLGIRVLAEQEFKELLDE